MQKIENLARLLHLSSTGKCFCVTASFLILATASFRAGEPVMTLAMNQPALGNWGNSVAAPADLASDIKSPPLNLKNSPPAAISPNDEKLAALSPGLPVEKQTSSGQRELFPLVREGSHPNKPVSVQAGYGRIWDDKSTLQKISSDHQEPGCAYVSANFSF